MLAVRVGLEPLVVRDLCVLGRIRDQQIERRGASLGASSDRGEQRRGSGRLVCDDENTRVVAGRWNRVRRGRLSG